MTTNEELLSEMRDFRRETREQFLRLNNRVRENEVRVAVLQARVSIGAAIGATLITVASVIAAFLGVRY